MQGFVNRAIQCFVRDTYGWTVWLNVIRRAGIGFTNFEAMLSYRVSSQRKSTPLRPARVYLTRTSRKELLQRRLRG